MAQHGLSPEELDALTEEERAGLEEESDDDTAAAAPDGEGDGGDAATDDDKEPTTEDDPDGEGDPKGKDGDDVPEGEKAAEDPKGEDDGEPAEEAEPDPEPVHRPKPLIDAALPEDFDDQVKAVSTERRELRTKFSDGEIDEDQFYDKMDELDDRRLELRMMKERADLSRQTTQQATVNDFQSAVGSFLKDHPEIRDNEDSYDAVDGFLRKITSDPENWNKMTPEQMVNKAYERFQKLTGATDDKPKAGGQKKPPKRPDAPKTLGSVPPSEAPETGNSKYAQLTRLLNSNDPSEVVRGEEMLGKMSEDEQNRYLATEE